jgi:hypothetical protein
MSLEKYKRKDFSKLLDAITLCSEALAYSVEVSHLNPYQAKLVITEFFHSLNRKGAIPNHLVENAIEITISRVKELKDF